MKAIKTGLSWLHKNIKIVIAADIVFLLFAVLISFATANPASTEDVQIVKSTYSTAEISWDAADGASAYRIYRSEDGKDYEYIDSTSDTTYTDTNLKTGTIYYYAVTSRNGLKSTALDTMAARSVVPSLEAPTLEVDTSQGEIKLSYSKVEGAAGYAILRDGEIVGESKGNTFVDETVGEKGGTFEYEVKAYRYEDNPVYSDESEKVEAQLNSIRKFSLKPSGDDLLIKWKNNDFYSNYKLYLGEELLTETQDNEYRLEDIELEKQYEISLLGFSEDQTVQSPKIERVFEVVEEPMTNEDALEAACEWGLDIAADDSFAYGTGSIAHSCGCYFCGTNIRKKGRKYAKTYCCNPFVHACFAHGAGDPAMLRTCQRGGAVGMNSSDYTRHGNWKNVGKPSLANLEKGDVIVWSNHVMLYVGDGTIVHAKSEGWGAGTICTDKVSSYYGNTKFVMRYIGTGRGIKKVVKYIEQE